MVVIVSAVGVLVALVRSDDGDEPGKVRADPGPSTEATTTSAAGLNPDAIFTWPDDCTAPAIGAAEIIGPDLLASAPVQSWTDSAQGQWLHDRLGVAGFPDVYSVGSAFVVMHGADGVVFAWFGPPDDTADLPLVPVEGLEGVASAELSPSVPFDTGTYRPAIVAGGVRLWLLTHPRDGYEFFNFPGLTSAPCLPDQNELRQAALQLASAANEQPYSGSLPPTAGRFAINADVGISITDSGDQHLVQVAERTLGRSVTLPGFNGPLLEGQGLFIYTGIPPQETNSDTRAGLGTHGFLPPRTTAGGLDILVLEQGADDSLDATNTKDIARVAQELNRGSVPGTARALSPRGRPSCARSITRSPRPAPRRSRCHGPSAGACPAGRR